MLNNVSYNSILEPSSEFISLKRNGTGTLLTLAFSPDREKIASLNAFLTCRVRFKGETDDFVRDVALSATVFDDNDSPPSVSNKRVLQLREEIVGPVSSQLKNLLQLVFSLSVQRVRT
ncbi:hypothetical protein ElyMa_002423900 [Elysia marginata]|uniref:Cadherin domain-containing protein n=1 Tax=Elysia marginata TaxID=1093978 RepID=A0AAV4GHH4_9GAST|nr:hypothetical protein ElyMa_002423900 [Elysia marginata]